MIGPTQLRCRLTALLLFAFGLSICGASFGVAATWTDARGVKITGEFVRLHEGQVVLSNKGKTLKIPLTQFSAADQEELKSLAAEAGELPSEEKGPSQEALDKVVAREWHEVSGHSFTARLINYKEGKVVFQPAEANKKPLLLALERLTPTDQQAARLQLIDLGLTERLWPVKRDALAGAAVKLPEDATLIGGAAPAAEAMPPEPATPPLAPEGAAAAVAPPAHVAPAAPAPPAKPATTIKTWIDTRGMKIVGDFVRLHEGLVILNNRGRMLKIPLAQFSALDQETFKALAAQANEAPIDEKGPTKEALEKIVAHEWQEVSGHSFTARLINYKDGKLVFQPAEANKKTLHLPLERLSPADQQQARLELIDLGLTERLWPIKRDAPTGAAVKLPDDATLIGGVPAAGPPAEAMPPEPAAPPPESVEESVAAAAKVAAPPASPKSASATARSGVRTWIDARGLKINGDFVRLHEGLVILNNKGRMVKVPLTQFNAADQAEITALANQANEAPIEEKGPSKDALDKVAAREWHETSGQVFTARLINYKDGKLVFQLAETNKKPLFVALERMTPDDQREARLQLIDLGLTDRLWPIKRDLAVGAQVKLPDDASLTGGVAGEPMPAEAAAPPPPPTPPIDAAPVAATPPVPTAAPAAPKRVPLVKTWIDGRGVKITGDFVRLHEGSVILNNKGKMLRIPLGQFSVADQAEIKSLADQATELPIGEKGPSKEMLDKVVAREWRDTSGQTFTARLINYKDGKLVFQLAEANKRPLYLAPDQLIPSDQQEARLQLIDLGLKERLWTIKRDAPPINPVSAPTP